MTTWGHGLYYFLLDTSNAGTERIKQNVAAALFTARQFLPGFFDRKAFLIVSLILPLVDFLTDGINAGSGFTYTTPD